MSEYFFARENTAVPIYAVHENFEDAAYITRFTFPSKPIPVLAKYRLKQEYNIPSMLLRPEFSISKDIYDSIDIKNIYGGNWIPIKVVDKGEHDFMMLQLTNEIDVIDHNRSVFKRFEDDDISGMKKLVLDLDKIAHIPLYKRLAFRDQFWGFHTFYHRDLVDKILSTNPSGVKFIPVDEFDESWVG